VCLLLICLETISYSLKISKKNGWCSGNNNNNNNDVPKRAPGPFADGDLVNIQNVVYPNRYIRCGGNNVNLQFGHGDWEVWIVRFGPGDTFCFENNSFKGQFLSLNPSCSSFAGSGCGSVSVANSCGGNQAFSVVPIGTNFGLRSSTNGQNWMRGDGSTLTAFAGNGGGVVNAQYYPGNTIAAGWEVWNIQKVSSSPFKEGALVNIENVAYPNRYIRSDGNIVNLQFTHSTWEIWILRTGPSGSWCLENNNFRGKFMQFSPTCGGASGSGCGSVQAVSGGCNGNQAFFIVPIGSSYGLRSSTNQSNWVRGDGSSITSPSGSGGGVVNGQYYGSSMAGGWEVWNFHFL